MVTECTKFLVKIVKNAISGDYPMETPKNRKEKSTALDRISYNLIGDTVEDSRKNKGANSGLTVCALFDRGGGAFVCCSLRIVVQSWVITLLTYIPAGTGAGLSFLSAFDCAHSVPIRFLFLISWE